MRKPQRIEIAIEDARERVAPETLEDVLKTLCGFGIIQGYQLGPHILVIRLPINRRPDAVLMALESNEVPLMPKPRKGTLE